MGISGLLPALKPIQNTKHLSEFKGKVVAVDAYVWLHRGVYACASDLAMGKNTHKYVDYAMYRVRLLQHHGIKPYIVFDGGPLPAKKGTENDRKARREESLAKGKALMALGKSSEARDHFIKSIDVTPQMAAQLMKALRAESVPFVCAPYEADAQLAYLERTGIADAVLTEDSDLLVFGCQTTLFKLDADAATVVCISRADFGTVAASAGDTNGISLIGWSDVQFRSMAILSGCDYLPSIPGIGLKTACNLLKKWRTVEGVIRAINIAGKKSVPTGYLKQFKLAEKCFLHQRVYCPTQEKLVHLTEVGPDWNEEFDAYVGGDMDSILAKNIAEGHHDPATHLPMTDINPGFVPRVLKSVRRVSNSPTRTSVSKGKGKGRQSLPTPGKPQTGGILSFFGPNPIIPPRTKEKAPVSSSARNTIVGKASGKRTLSEVMEQDLDQKKKHRASNSPFKFRFFGHHEPDSLSSNIRRRHSDGLVSVAGPSRFTIEDEEKENIDITVDDEEFVETSDQEELDGSDLSLLAQIDMVDARMGVSYANEIPDAVEQEEGYISPSPSCSKDAQDLSSPPSHPRRVQHGYHQKDINPTDLIPSDEEDADFGADAISSPISVKKQKSRGGLLFQVQQTPTARGSYSELSIPTGQILVNSTPSPTCKRIYPDADDVPSPTLYRGPDLRSMLDNDNSTELEYDVTPQLDLRGGSDSPPSPSPETPESIHLQQLGIHFVGDNNVAENLQYDSDLDEDEEARREEEMDAKRKVVMEGWKARWSSTSKTPVHSNGMVLPRKNPTQQKKTGTPLSQPMPRSSNGVRPRSPLKGMSISASGPRSIRPSSPKKAFAFIPGSRPIRPHNLKRADTNLTPVNLGRSSVAGGAHKPPRTSASQLTGNTPTTKIAQNVPRGSKPQQNLLFFEAVNKTSTSSITTIARHPRQTIDLTQDDDDDDIEELDSTTRHLGSSLVVSEETVLSSSQLRLSQYRCT